MMKKALFLCAMITLTLGLKAQINQGGVPVSFTENLSSDIPVEELTAPFIEAQKDTEKNGTMYEYARSIECDITPRTHGTWTTLSDGSKLWRLSIKSEGAQALGLYYDAFWIPSNGQLFVYNEDKTQVIGAFTNQNNHESGLFANELIQGEVVTLEYHQKGEGMPIMHINEVAYAYRDVNHLFEMRDFGDSDDCEVNINCSEGDDWQLIKRSACRISIKAGNMYGWCSGALINTTAEDCTPYVLTADHCGYGSSSYASSADHNQWIFYFNYEADDCENPSSSPASNSLTGCSVRSYSGAVGGVNGNIGGTSDFYLVELNNEVPYEVGAFMAGWNRSNTASTSGTSIHHPSGDIKKISTYTQTLTNGAWQGGGNTHWRVRWAGTDNGHGVTEGGSSGSPIFNAAGQIIGDLSGGASYCSNTNGQDLYGKLYHSWDQGGTADDERLKPWLDPTNSGAISLDGKVCGTSFFADFEASITNVITGGTTTFSYAGTGNPTAYSWVFYGGNPITSTDENPVVTYANDGNYTAKLTAESGMDESTEIKSAYITVSPDGEVESSVIESENTLSLFPNPTSGVVYLAISNNKLANIKVYDVVGNTIYNSLLTTETIAIDLQDRPNGVYFIEVMSNNRKTVQKVILNR